MCKVKITNELSYNHPVTQLEEHFRVVRNEFYFILRFISFHSVSCYFLFLLCSLLYFTSHRRNIYFIFWLSHYLSHSIRKMESFSSTFPPHRHFVSVLHHKYIHTSLIHKLMHTNTLKHFDYYLLRFGFDLWAIHNN